MEKLACRIAFAIFGTHTATLAYHLDRTQTRTLAYVLTESHRAVPLEQLNRTLKLTAEITDLITFNRKW